MKRFIIGAAASLAVTLVVLSAIALSLSQRADYGWNPAIAEPAFEGKQPRVLFDEGHNNASSVGFAGRYWPFARLLRADGMAVTRGRSEITRARLDGMDVVVIANASGAPKPQFFGFNLPVRTDKRRDDPAFTAGEIESLRSWVAEGGALLLIADHAPFGAAVADLGAAFGVLMHGGFVEVPGEPSDPLVFSRDNGRLGDHPIVRGSGPGASVRRVMTYTGQSLDGPPGAKDLLRLPETAVEAVPEGDSLAVHSAGRAQGVALVFGRGRVVVLGEAGMATAQVSRRERYGINIADNDNALFVINIMHWLLGRL